ncbi:hypothetical protein LUZ61_018874 [Rhynchospora tenuis]|uniref:Uncharacterized protein n=1 Tax=Rhynchospora tenuis TaxID=198213 RepID=A0AAD5ZA19_9POAL|nr:hypothetical protein LUZ61_018874 [Rhynchospora tenuis]
MALEIPLTKQIQLRLEELDGMDQRRLIAQIGVMKKFQARMTRAYEKISRPGAFRKGELVLVLKQLVTGRHHSPKFTPNWEGPFIIDQVYDGGAYLLTTKNGEHHLPVLNGRYLKKYYSQNQPPEHVKPQQHPEEDFITNWVEAHEGMTQLFSQREKVLEEAQTLVVAESTEDTSHEAYLRA